MPTHLYCLLDAERDSAPPADAGAVRALAVGGIVAWVSTTAEDRISREGRRAADLVVEHDRVIARALARGVTPVPATLADPYPSDAAVTTDIAARREEIMKSLRRVDGTFEMAIVLAPRANDSAAEPPAGQSPGRAYLERLRNQPALLTAAADDLDLRLEPLCLSSSRRVELDRIGLSHLIRRTDLQRYRAIALGSASERYRMVVDGPRAPYSFASFSPQPPDALPARHETGKLSRD